MCKNQCLVAHNNPKRDGLCACKCYAIDRENDEKNIADGYAQRTPGGGIIYSPTKFGQLPDVEPMMQNIDKPVFKAGMYAYDAQEERFKQYFASRIGWKVNSVSRILNCLQREGVRRIKIKRFGKTKFGYTRKWGEWKLNLRVTNAPTILNEQWIKNL